MEEFFTFLVVHGRLAGPQLIDIVAFAVQYSYWYEICLIYGRVPALFEGRYRI